MSCDSLPDLISWLDNLDGVDMDNTLAPGNFVLDSARLVRLEMKSAERLESIRILARKANYHLGHCQSSPIW